MRELRIDCLDEVSGGVLTWSEGFMALAVIEIVAGTAAVASGFGAGFAPVMFAAAAGDFALAVGASAAGK